MDPEKCLILLQLIAHTRVLRLCSAGILAGNLLWGQGLMPAGMPALHLRRSRKDKAKHSFAG